MKSEEEFDELLKNKFSDENAFPFEEDKWARMEEMIMADEAKKKRRKFLWVFFSGFITALFFVIPFIWYLFTSDEMKEERNLKTENTPPNTKNNLENTKDNANSDVKNIDTDPIHLKNKSKEKTNPKNENEEYLNQNVRKNKEKSTLATEGNLPKNKKNKVPKNNKSWINKENKKKKDELMGINPNAGVGPSTTVYCGQNEKDKDSIKKNNVTTLPTVDTLQKLHEVVAKIDTLTELRVNSNENDSTPEKNLDLPFSKFSFFGVLGGQYNVGFAKNDGNSFSPYVGGMFQYRFSKTWAFRAGLGIYQVSNLNFQKTITERTYDFGYRDQITQIGQKSLIYTSSTFEIAKILNKNSFALGVNPTILVANQSQVQNYEVSSLLNSSVISSKSFRHGYGLNSFDLQFSFSYIRSLNEKWMLGANYNLGLLDVRQSSWTGNENKEKNQFIRFNLIYKIK